jgi:hypothetical protein
MMRISCDHTANDKFSTKKENWRNLFGGFTVCVKEGVGVPVSVVFFKDSKTKLANLLVCFNKPSTTQSDLIIHNAHARTKRASN